MDALYIRMVVLLRLERVQVKFILYALRKFGWMNMNLFPPYESRCKLLNLDTLCRRRENSSVIFVRDVLCARIDSFISFVGNVGPTSHKIACFIIREVSQNGLRS
jgi:hypothetical protein